MKVLRNNSLKNLKTDDFIHIWDDVSCSCEEENKCDFSDLRLSKYNIIKHYSNGSIVINTLSESVIILSEQEKKWFQSFKSDDNLENKDFLQKLYNLGFLVKNETDELSLLYLITSQALRNPPKKGMPYRRYKELPLTVCLIFCLFSCLTGLADVMMRLRLSWNGL